MTVGSETVGSIGQGFLILVGVSHSDTPETAAKVASKIAGLRVFEDAEGRMNLGLSDVGGQVLCVSQFTLYGDIRKGRRPSFDAAARPEVAIPVFDAFCATMEAEGLHCERGRFGAHMMVELVNDGPVTLIVDSESLEQPRRA